MTDVCSSCYRCVPLCFDDQRMLLTAPASGRRGHSSVTYTPQGLFQLKICRIGCASRGEVNMGGHANMSVCASPDVDTTVYDEHSVVFPSRYEFCAIESDHSSECDV